MRGCGGGEREGRGRGEGGEREGRGREEGRGEREGRGFLGMLCRQHSSPMLWCPHQYPYVIVCADDPAWSRGRRSGRCAGCDDGGGATAQGSLVGRDQWCGMAAGRTGGCVFGVNHGTQSTPRTNACSPLSLLLWGPLCSLRTEKAAPRPKRPVQIVDCDGGKPARLPQPRLPPVMGPARGRCFWMTLQAAVTRMGGRPQPLCWTGLADRQAQVCASVWSAELVGWGIRWCCRCLFVIVVVIVVVIVAVGK
jgi:hypothetical protein